MKKCSTFHKTKEEAGNFPETLLKGNWGGARQNMKTIVAHGLKIFSKEGGPWSARGHETCSRRQGERKNWASQPRTVIG